MADGRRALVIGGGIAGLAAAIELCDGGRFDAVELWEADDRLGGKIKTSAFGGLDRVDEGADAYLLRVPDAAALADEAGIDAIVHPTAATAAVWHDGLHPLPDGIVLGMPGAVWPFVTSSLLSWRGKVRAACEPFLPATDADDSIGRLVRHRFGDEVHERLVDALVGSIYAADTDRWSLESVPKLAALAGANRSLLLAARSARRGRPAASGPVFGAPRDGMQALVDASADMARARGVSISTGRSADEVGGSGTDGWTVDGERFDAVVLATPAAPTARLLRDVAPASSDALATIEATDVVMVRLAVSSLPRHVAGRSGYLVPKPDQRNVTAVSFASQKWAHLRPPGGDELVRVSLGRDGLPVMHLSDDEIVAATLSDLSLHLGVGVDPSDVSITRWRAAFPQYRPHHVALIADAERTLPAGVGLAGASYHGIGIPACVASGRRAARSVQDPLSGADGFLT